MKCLVPGGWTVAERALARWLLFSLSLCRRCYHRHIYPDHHCVIGKVWNTGEEYEGGWKNNLQQGQGKHRWNTQWKPMGKTGECIVRTKGKQWEITVKTERKHSKSTRETQGITMRGDFMKTYHSPIFQFWVWSLWCCRLGSGGNTVNRYRRENIKNISGPSTRASNLFSPKRQ